MSPQHELSGHWTCQNTPHFKGGNFLYLFTLALKLFEVPILAIFLIYWQLAEAWSLPLQNLLHIVTQSFLNKVYIVHFGSFEVFLIWTKWICTLKCCTCCFSDTCCQKKPFAAKLLQRPFTVWKTLSEMEDVFGRIGYFEPQGSDIYWCQHYNDNDSWS